MEPITSLSIEEEKYILDLVSKYIDLSVIESEKPMRTFVKIDKRDLMYGGNGVVYLLQMFNKENLANNRLAAYMVLPNKNDSSGFHTHGDRHEQELYVVMHGEGEFADKIGKNGKIKTQIIKRGDITSVRNNGYHFVKNISDEPLILFVITTYEK